MEEMKEASFSGTYCMTLVEDKNFYSGLNQDGIYSYLREKNPIHDQVIKPTGKKDEQLAANGFYSIEWKNCRSMKYYVVKL